MLSFASSLASQIGLLIAILNKSNYKSVVLELSKVCSNFQWFVLPILPAPYLSHESLRPFRLSA